MQANAWVIGQVLATGVTGVDICHARDPKAIEVAVQASRYPFDYPGVPRQPFKDLPYGGEGLRGSGSQGFPAQIWGVPANQYLHMADVWPLNPRGELILGTKIEDHFALANCEKTLAVQGVTFTEWGPGDMNMSLNGLDAFPLGATANSGDGEGGGRTIAPNVAAARLRILEACKKTGVKIIDTPRGDAIVESIKMGMTMFAVTEDTAVIGREYTKRKMPV
jgi:4-hydroxy-2-oxoheptanedioate aldolase